MSETAAADREPSGLERLVAQAADEAAGRPAEAHPGEHRVEVEPVNSPERRPLYASRQKIHPKRVHGRFRMVKWVVMAVTLAIYYLTPWLRWDRGAVAPDQAVLIDFPNRKFYFFFIEIWPQEVYYITGLLILAALVLFLITSLAGRVWCGYSCPQTVWTDLFVHIERWIEGDRNRRIRLDRAPWGPAKIAKKTVKHAIWLAIAVATGGAWVFYFADAPTLAGQLLAFEAPTTAYISIGVLTFTTYMLGAIAREQVCTYMCPWPRIQGAMFDEQSFLVSYRPDRGEPRGPHKRGQSWDGRGDCIDCNQCVAVCPVGIDIRDGGQLECIQCALCIDACDAIMDKVGRPRGLIAYETFSHPVARAEGRQARVKLIRPRTMIYAGLIAVVGGIMLFALLTRDTLHLNVLRDRNPLFVTLSDGSVRNGYTLKIVNKEHMEKTLTVSVDGLEGATLFEPLSGQRGRIDVATDPDSLASIKLYVSVPPDRLAARDLRDGTGEIRFVVYDAATGNQVVETTSFRGPNR